jgi:hypothetical protein
MREQWDAKGVRQAIAKAIRVIEATAGRVGHKQLKAAMPDYQYSVADLAEQLQAEVEAKRQGETTMHDRLASRVPPSAIDISRADLVLFGDKVNRPWLRMIEAYPEHRATLIRACWAAAWGMSSRRLCREMGWNLSTFQRHRDFAAELIATHLNRAKVVPWL